VVFVEAKQVRGVYKLVVSKQRWRRRDLMWKQNWAKPPGMRTNESYVVVVVTVIVRIQPDKQTCSKESEDPNKYHV